MWRVDAFDVDRRAVARRDPQPAGLPAPVAIIDAALETLGEEAHRIGDTKLHHRAVDEGEQRVRLVAGHDRHVGAETKNVMLVDPGIIRIFRRSRIALVVRSRNRVEIPALRTLVAQFCARSIERSLAFAAVKAAEVT